MTSLTSIPLVSHGWGTDKIHTHTKRGRWRGVREREREKWAVKRDQSVMKCLRSDKRRGHAEGKGNGEVPCIVIISFSAALPLKVDWPFPLPRAQHHSQPKQTVFIPLKETTRGLFWLKPPEKLTRVFLITYQNQRLWLDSSPKAKPKHSPSMLADGTWVKLKTPQINVSDFEVCSGGVFSDQFGFNELISNAIKGGKGVEMSWLTAESASFTAAWTPSQQAGRALT